jgi:hypothetical protein
LLLIQREAQQTAKPNTNAAGIKTAQRQTSNSAASNLKQRSVKPQTAQRQTSNSRRRQTAQRIFPFIPYL